LTVFFTSGARDAGVEVDVLLGVAGDRGDVVDALELHHAHLAASEVFSPPGPGNCSHEARIHPDQRPRRALAGFIGQKVFDAIWGKVDEQEPPQPEHREVSSRSWRSR
jgi:hypothetical protein